MIPAHGFVAVFAPVVGAHANNRRTVIAWDDKGEPLLAGLRGLQRASDCSGFSHVEEQEQSPTVIPGGGWMLSGSYVQGGTWTKPVLAWNVYADGTAYPIHVDAERVTYEIRLTDEAMEGVRLSHPDSAFGDAQSAAAAAKRHVDPDCPECRGSSWTDDDPGDPQAPLKRCACYIPPAAEPSAT